LWGEGGDSHQYGNHHKRVNNAHPPGTRTKGKGKRGLSCRKRGEHLSYLNEEFDQGLRLFLYREKERGGCRRRKLPVTPIMKVLPKRKKEEKAYLLINQEGEEESSPGTKLYDHLRKESRFSSMVERKEDLMGGKENIIASRERKIDPKKGRFCEVRQRLRVEIAKGDRSKEIDLIPEKGELRENL